MNTHTDAHTHTYTLVPRRSTPLCLANPAYRHVFAKNGFPDYHFTSLIRQPRCPPSAKGNTIQKTNKVF